MYQVLPQPPSTTRPALDSLSRDLLNVSFAQPEGHQVCLDSLVFFQCNYQQVVRSEGHEYLEGDTLMAGSDNSGEVLEPVEGIVLDPAHRPRGPGVVTAVL